MKYIRTKDGIYKTFDGMMLSMPPRYAIKVDGAIKYIPETEVIKTADRLEELCDNVLLVKKVSDEIVTDTRLYVNCMDDFPEEARYWVLYHGYVAYGTIWTRRGQIFVAELKGATYWDKGEWELI